MEDSKYFLFSKTILFAVMGFVASLGIVFKTLAPVVAPDKAQQVTQTVDAVEAEKENISVNLLAIISAVLSLGAIYGRISAKTKLTTGPITPVLFLLFLMVLLPICGCQGNLQKANSADLWLLGQIQMEYAYRCEANTLTDPIVRMETAATAFETTGFKDRAAYWREQAVLWKEGKLENPCSQLLAQGKEMCDLSASMIE
jgi:hypothetical protein